MPSWYFKIMSFLNVKVNTVHCRNVIFSQTRYFFLWQVLLALLVNKVGDPEYKIAAQASHLLTKLGKHPLPIEFYFCNTFQFLKKSRFLRNFFNGILKWILIKITFILNFWRCKNDNSQNAKTKVFLFVQINIWGRCYMYFCSHWMRFIVDSG